jgi:hypothetical protein
MAVIFIPGIKGSKLVDTYPTDFRVRWSLEDLVVGNLFEDPLDFELKEGLYDRDEHHLFREGELINFAYEKMVRRLREWNDQPLYLFPYDWRKPLEVTASRLVEFIDHVQGKLGKDGDPVGVSFVTHSMGGLVLRSALELRRPNPFRDVERIAFVAPPFRGSCDIPLTLIAGEKSGWLGEDEDFRKLARTFPAVYQLIPSFEGAAIAAETGTPLDLFDFENWQQSVRPKGKLEARFLRDAEAFVRGSAARHGGSSPAPMISETLLRRHAEKILILTSVGHDTCHQIPVETENRKNQNWFDFGNRKIDRLGDQRVHLKSAAIRGLTLAAYRRAEPHATICRDRLVINSVSWWLQGERLVKMQPRTARDTFRRRPRRRFFQPWDGSEASFGEHIV